MPTATFTPNSQQFDATRSEIIASFRQKIQQEARSKLSHVQLEELIDIFIIRLQFPSTTILLLTFFLFFLQDLAIFIFFLCLNYYKKCD